MSDRVYSKLRAQIASGERPAWSHLVQERLAAEFSTSRTPVREALGRLTAEGLVSWTPGQGYLVAGVAEREVLDVQAVRVALECAALTDAIPMYTIFDIERLRSVQQEMIDADESDDHFELTRRFHEALVSPCPNTLMLKYLNDVWSQPVSMKVTGKYTARVKSTAVMIKDHGEIIEALESDSPYRAVDLLRDHIAHVYPNDLSSTIATDSEVALRARSVSRPVTP